jgi:hypothetical protein
LWRLTWASSATRVRPGAPVPFGVNLRAILLVSTWRSVMATLLSRGDSPCLPDGSAAVTAAFVGVLSLDDAASQRRAVEKLLAQAHTLILDVTDLRLQYNSTVTIFSRALLDVGGWPSVRLVVMKPDRRFGAALEATGVSRDVHVVDSINRALAKLETRARRVSRRAWLSTPAVDRLILIG